MQQSLKAARYHRYSDKDQSNGSIERQDIITADWSFRNKVEIIDTFVDDGYSARTFDRPDMKRLLEFIKQHHKNINYLLVSELTRFSRDLADAMNMIKMIQGQYGVQIVSCSRSLICDYYEHNSFLLMSLEFTFGNVENIKRQNDINGGIYTAKAKEQRFIGSHAPFGYRKEGGKIKHLVLHDEEAAVVRFIYQSYIHNVPIMHIYKEACRMGLKTLGNSAIQKMLSNPIYSGQQFVKPWKSMPGGLFPAKHDAIIDIITWKQVQEKLKSSKKKGISLSEELPLKNVLHCHCGRMLTGAPSKGKLGKYYYYYKCNTASIHNNISANKAHTQLQEMLGYMSVPEHIISAIRDESKKMLDEQLKENKKVLQHQKRLQDENEKKIVSLEEKFVANQVNFETYNRWYADLQQQRTILKNSIGQLNTGKNEIYLLLEKNLQLLSDMQWLYNCSTLIQKQELLNTVFDRRLYYINSTYRTPYMMELFKHNLFILNQKQLLFLDEKRENIAILPSGGAAGNRTLVQTYPP